MKRILFITTTNLATNPRLVKEVRLACSMNFNCNVLMFNIGNWSDMMTTEIEKEFPSVNFIKISATRTPFLPWLVSSLLEKAFNYAPIQWLSLKKLSIAVSKRSFLLFQSISQIHGKFDWVIAHNPGSFYPALVIAKKMNAQLGIDVEDYHPGESNDKKLQDITRKLMQMVLAKASYCSYASPLIMYEVHRQVNNLSSCQFVILNGFPKNEFLQPVFHNHARLKLVWFSQNISAGRGLELILPVVKKYHTQIELHLIGSPNRYFIQQYIKDNTGVFVHLPMPQIQLHKFLSDCDVGLATDLPVNYNREIALTNKIIAYAQAGLFILSMHTLAQDEFLKGGRLQYLQMDNTVKSIEQTLLQLLRMNQEGLLNKQRQFVNGAEYSWENICMPLSQVWNA
jgi:glycosyltransferase involved in cell wall biosynthesis